MESDTVLKYTLMSFGSSALFGGLAFGLTPSHWLLHALFVLSAIAFVACFTSWISIRVRDRIQEDAAEDSGPAVRPDAPEPPRARTR